MGQNNSSNEKAKPQSGQGPVYTREQVNSMLRTQQQLLLDNAKQQSQKSPSPSSSSTPTSRTPAANSSSLAECQQTSYVLSKSSNDPAHQLYPSLSSPKTPLQPTYPPQVNNTALNSVVAPLQPTYPPQAVAYTNYTPTGSVASPLQQAYQPQVVNKPSTAPRGCPEDFVMVQNQYQRFSVQPSAPPAADIWSPSKSTPTNTNTRILRPNSQKRDQDGPRVTSHVSCVSCKKTFGLQIYQCGQGHSSCDTCKMRNVPCGVCHSSISNTRNFSMEETLEKMNSPCLNAKYGCRLSLKTEEMQLHLLECPYSEMICPVASMLGTVCYWKGGVSEIVGHFKSHHIEHCQGDVDKEMQIFNIKQDTIQIHLVELAIYKFLVLLKISEQEKRMYMTVQFLGTKVSADKWTYEFHVYNKTHPRRKYQYNDSCLSLGTPLREIFDCNSACLPLKYASTFSNSGSLTYKFFIKKTVDDKEFSNNRGRGGARGRGRRAKRGGLSKTSTDSKN